MNLKLLLFLGVICSLVLPAQSVTVINTNNSALSPSGVIGDTLHTAIRGAAASSSVVLSWTQNGVPGMVTVGSTNISGDFDLDTTAVSGNDGAWTEQWSVGGVNVGANFSLELFNTPSVLTVASVSASSPDICGSSYTPPGGTSYSGFPYGPSASIQYQIFNVSGTFETVPNTGLGIMLEPEETVSGVPKGDIGCTTGCPSGWMWTPPSAQYASSTGSFYDVPFAGCVAFAFSNLSGSVITINIKIGNHFYPVRTSQFTYSSSSPGHGSMTNNLGDVSYTQ